MQAIVRWGMVLSLTPFIMAFAAQASQANSIKIDKQLQGSVIELRNVAGSMQTHAQRTIPADLNKYEKTILLTKIRNLETTADTVMKLSIQIENWAKKAHRRMLTRSDMDNLYLEVDALMENIRKKRQVLQRSFEEFDQKANQLFNILSTILKSIKETQTATIKNLT
jgi:hypothetical protein